MRDQTLELYVKMCDCPEIQGQNTRYNDGDLYVERADIGKKESPIGVWCWNCEGEFYLGGEAERLFVNSVWLPLRHICRKWYQASSSPMKVMTRRRCRTPLA